MVPAARNAANAPTVVAAAAISCLGKDDGAGCEECGECSDCRGCCGDQLFDDWDVVVGLVGVDSQNQPEGASEKHTGRVDHHEPTHRGAG